MKLTKLLILIILLLQLSACGQKGVLYTNSKSLETESNKQDSENKPTDTTKESNQ